LILVKKSSAHTKVYVTTDNGQTWSPQPIPLSDVRRTAICGDKIALSFLTDDGIEIYTGIKGQSSYAQIMNSHGFAYPVTACKDSGAYYLYYLDGNYHIEQTQF
jgi:hypothetical protein